jgi:DNA-binding protein HU-beta
MTKAEFIQAVQVELDDNKITKPTIEKVLRATYEVSVALLKDGQDSPLFGLGALKVVKRAARTGRNPQTGAALKIPAHNAVKFSAGKALKDALKG